MFKNFNLSCLCYALSCSNLQWALNKNNNNLSFLDRHPCFEEVGFGLKVSTLGKCNNAHKGGATLRHNLM